MRRLIGLCCMLLAVMLLGGCGNKTEKESFHIVVATQNLFDDALPGLEAALERELPKLGDVQVTGIRLGAYSSKELMHICALIEEKSVDLLIADEVAAKRAGDSGDSYFTLDELFEASEIEAWEKECVRVPVVGMDGKLTGEESELCGVALGEDVNQTLGLSDMRMYILVNTTRKADAQTVFAHLAGK